MSVILVIVLIITVVIPPAQAFACRVLLLVVWVIVNSSALRILRQLIVLKAYHAGFVVIVMELVYVK
jgi:hypothetical protein